MKLRLFKKMNILVSACLVFCLIGGATDVRAADDAGEISLGGISLFLNRFYDNTDTAVTDTATALLDNAVTIPDNVAIANVNDYVNIRSGPGTSYGVVGYLTSGGMCVVKEVTDNGWAKIESGTVKGYIYSSYLYMGEEGRKKAEETASLMATVTAGTVNFRSEPNTNDSSNILTSAKKGEALKVIEETVISRDCSTTMWVKAYFDDMEGYIAKQFVDIAFDWTRAVAMTSIVGAESASDLSGLRASIIIEAQKHLGLKYVWGGNSLYSGCDCSGFCLQVYKACGIDISKLPRTSYDMASCSRGRRVSISEAKPGDLVFYGTSSGEVNHVAIYLGDGKIIHEKGRAYGCVISSVYYRDIIKVKNFID